MYAVACTQGGDVPQLRPWVIGYLLNLLGRPTLECDLDAPLCGRPCAETMLSILVCVCAGLRLKDC